MHSFNKVALEKSATMVALATKVALDVTLVANEYRGRGGGHGSGGRHGRGSRRLLLLQSANVLVKKSRSWGAEI